jgi:hypothetical protein
MEGQRRWFFIACHSGSGKSAWRRSNRRRRSGNFSIAKSNAAGAGAVHGVSDESSH